MTAEMAMSCIYISETDPGGFHLSFITAIEMISQLTVVALHSLAGLQSKSREVWARETRGRFVKPIRQQHGMQIEMQIRSLRNHGGVCLCEADYRITDQAGGLFMYWVKCALV